MRDKADFFGKIGMLQICFQIVLVGTSLGCEIEAVTAIECFEHFVNRLKKLIKSFPYQKM